MFSFLTPYLTIIKGVGALIVVLAIWYFIHQYRTGQEAKAQLQQMSQQLEDERSCLVGTVCAKRTQDEADKAAKLVKEVQATADKENKRIKEEQDAKTKASADAHAKAVADLQKKLADKNKQLAERATHDKPCRDWLNEAIPECVL